MGEETKTSTLRWLITLRGILFLAFGLIVLVYPGMTVLGLVYIFGIMAIISGVASFFVAATDKNWVYLFEGILGVFLGILVMVYPAITAAVFIWFFIIWLLIVGLMIFVGGVAGPKGTPRAMLIIGGAITLFLAVFLIVQPIWIKDWDILWVIGALSLISGAMQILFAVFAKKKTIAKVEE